MKILRVLMFIGIFICTLQNSFAAQAYFDWENDMDLFIGYNEEFDMIEALADIRSETNQNDQFSLGLYVDGREYRKFFKYDAPSKILFVEFEIPQTLRDDTTIFLSIKDAQYNEVYSTIPTNYTTGVYAKNQNTSIRSELGSTHTSKDYGVFSMQVSRSNKTITSTHGSSSSDDTNKRINISDLTRAELLNKVSTKDYTEEEVPEIIESLEKYNIISSKEDNSSTQQESISTKKTYIPKYKNQKSEPKTINGIGNSRTYNSWRSVK